MAQPWLPGAPHETVAAPSARCAVTLPTRSGTPHGTTGAEAADCGPQPARLRARTRNCWACPLGRLAHCSDVPVVVFTAPVERICTSYSMIGSPPLPGGLQRTLIVLSPRSPTGAAGASGGRSGCSGADAELNWPSPLAFTARTMNVYSWPFDRPSQRNVVVLPTRWIADAPPPICRS